MDYEKAYKEALERAKAGKPMDEVFPELKESEDERIRKEIIRYLKSKVATAGEEELLYFKRWIAHLEKQKEQKPAEKPEDIHNRGYIKGVEDAYHNINEAKVILKKLAKENPKPAECINIEKLAEHIKAEFESFRNLLKKKGIDYQPAEVYWTDFARLFVSSTKKLYQPAEWSEEDKHRLEQAVRALGRNGYFVLMDWLKELPNRFSIQQKQEWSEEDEMAIKSLINYFESKTEEEINSAKKTVDWLKSLRPQPRWKPSEEQINALRAFVGMIHPDARYNAVLSLLDELKAL